MVAKGLTLSHDDIIHSMVYTLVVLDKGQHEVLLFFRINQVVVGLVVPNHRLDVIDIEVH